MTQHVIKAIRMWATKNSTISEFEINDARPRDGEIRHGYFLECPGPDTTARGLRLRIPEGTYTLKWRTETDLGGVRPYLPVPWLYNGSVPDSRYIYIHNGNFPQNTDGCLLIGSTRHTDAVGRGNSVTSLLAVKRYLDRVGIENVRLEITSKYS